YHVIASNRDGSAADVLIWYRQRGEHSENGIKELKNGFGLERMPCGQESANAVFFRIGVIAHNLFVLFRHSALGEGWQQHRVATVRWRVFQIPGKVIRHAGAWVLKVSADLIELFTTIRTRSAARLHDPGR
ncbi:transposase, partial [Acidithiobacillus sp. MC6.1]|nr:transposase [Acidithiobacillus sp. MC6.1]